MAGHALRDTAIILGALVAAAGAASGHAGASSGNTGTPPGAPEKAVIKVMLRKLGAPRTGPDIDSMAAWIRHETPWPPVAAYNPMNTTEPEPGAGCFNSDCVRNYVSWRQGIRATVVTLRAGYPGIVAALRTGNGLCGMAPDEFLTWSGGGYSSVC
jgi:hypothetical protein